MRKVLVALVLAGFLLAPIVATAAEPPPNYLVAKLGAYIPGSKTLGISDAPSGMKFKTAFDGELAYGRRLLPNLAVELGAGWFKTKSDTFHVLIGEVTTSVDAEVEVIPVTLNAKGIYPIDQLDLYGLAGVGWYFAKAKIKDDTGDHSKNKSAFGFQLGLGAEYNFMPNIYAGVEARYFWAKPDFGSEGDVAIGKVKIDGTQLTANIGYRF